MSRRAGEVHYLFNSSAARTVARPCSWLYRAALRLRSPADVHKLPVPVISIGNIHAGGTGKTPLVISIANHLVKEGRKPAVVSRGYKGRLSSKGSIVSITSSARDVGDEPLEIARSCPDAGVYIAAERISAARLAAETSDVLILDDGFQHRAVGRDIDIVVLPSDSHPALERLLPLGRLREPLQALERADVIVIMHEIELDKPESHFEAIWRDYSAAPIFHAIRRPKRVLFGPNGSEISIGERRIVAFSGIAHPDRFYRSIEALGGKIVESLNFPDHHNYTTSDLRRIAHLANSDDTIAVTTQKDSARLSGVPVTFEYGVLESEIVCTDLMDYLDERLAVLRTK